MSDTSRRILIWMIKAYMNDWRKSLFFPLLYLGHMNIKTILDYLRKSKFFNIYFEHVEI